MTATTPSAAPGPALAAPADPRTAAVVLFDVNQTLSDMSELGERFYDVGIAAELAETWFAELLRDGFALTMAGAPRPFTEVAEQSLRALLSGEAVHGGPDVGLAHIMAAFDAFPMHDDVADGVQALTGVGRRLVALSNGSTDATERLLARSGLAKEFDRVLSVEDSGSWKPAPAAYEYAARECGVDVSQMLLVAVHPWDVDGASRAGLQTAWVDRSRRHYPSVFTPPDLHVTGIDDLAAQLTR
jgi:2-haloacid dehalogenase